MAFKFQSRDGLTESPKKIVEQPAVENSSPRLGGTANEAIHSEYEAYRFSSALQAPPTLWVRCHVGKSACDFAPAYAFRRHLHYDGNGYFIGMNYTDCRVQVFGRNLHDLFLKLLRNEVEWIQEHDPRKWQTPSEESSAPIITSIKISFKAHDPEDKTDLNNLSTQNIKH
jgi:hypothetical protein